VGEFRAIFAVRDGVVRVATIGKRNDDDVYRRLGWKWITAPLHGGGQGFDFTADGSTRGGPRRPT